MDSIFHLPLINAANLIGFGLAIITIVGVVAVIRIVFGSLTKGLSKNSSEKDNLMPNKIKLFLLFFILTFYILILLLHYDLLFIDINSNSMFFQAVNVFALNLKTFFTYILNFSSNFVSTDVIISKKMTKIFFFDPLLHTSIMYKNNIFLLLLSSWILLFLLFLLLYKISVKFFYFFSFIFSLNILKGIICFFLGIHDLFSIFILKFQLVLSFEKKKEFFDFLIDHFSLKYLNINFDSFYVYIENVNNLPEILKHFIIFINHIDITTFHGFLSLNNSVGLTYSLLLLSLISISYINPNVSFILTEPSFFVPMTTFIFNFLSTVFMANTVNLLFTPEALNTPEFLYFSENLINYYNNNNLNLLPLFIIINNKYLKFFNKYYIISFSSLFVTNIPFKNFKSMFKISLDLFLKVHHFKKLIMILLKILLNILILFFLSYNMLNKLLDFPYLAHSTFKFLNNTIIHDIPYLIFFYVFYIFFSIELIFLVIILANINLFILCTVLEFVVNYFRYVPIKD